jgi:hypothetical protein
VFWGIFRNLKEFLRFLEITGVSGIFQELQEFSEILRNLRMYSGILRNFQQ